MPLSLILILILNLILTYSVPYHNGSEQNTHIHEMNVVPFLSLFYDRVHRWAAPAVVLS